MFPFLSLFFHFFPPSFSLFFPSSPFFLLFLREVFYFSYSMVLLLLYWMVVLFTFFRFTIFSCRFFTLFYVYLLFVFASSRSCRCSPQTFFFNVFLFHFFPLSTPCIKLGSSTFTPLSSSFCPHLFLHSLPLTFPSTTIATLHSALCYPPPLALLPSSSSPPPLLPSHRLGTGGRYSPIENEGMTPIIKENGRRDVWLMRGKTLWGRALWRKFVWLKRCSPWRRLLRPAKIE